MIFLNPYRFNNYDPDAEAYFAQLTVQPSTGFKNAVNTFILTLKADGNWNELDRFWLHATELQQHARVSIVNPSSTQITEVNSPTWAANQGYTGNSANMYLNSNYNISTGTKYTQNSASLGQYSRSNLTGNGGDMGVVTNGSTGAGAFVNIRTSGNTFNYNLNSANGVVGAANSDSRGLFVSVRTASNAQSSYKNGVQQSTNTNASTTPPNLSAFLMAYNQNGTPLGFTGRQNSVHFFGSSAINQSTFYDAVQSLAISIGFNV